MNLEDALSHFRAGRRPYTAADLRVIAEVVSALKVGDFFTVKKDYVTDPNDIVHIHPRMIVAAKSFPGSTHRGPKPYPVQQHFRKLSHWSD
jgi:hypothetical protein